MYITDNRPSTVLHFMVDDGDGLSSRIVFLL